MWKKNDKMCTCVELAESLRNVLSESYCQNGLAILAQAWVNRPAFWSPGHDRRCFLNEFSTSSLPDQLYWRYFMGKLEALSVKKKDFSHEVWIEKGKLPSVDSLFWKIWKLFIKKRWCSVATLDYGMVKSRLYFVFWLESNRNTIENYCYGVMVRGVVNPKW